MDLDWFPFYTGKWKASGDIQQMDYFEKGLYLEMLIYQWHNDRIPSDPKVFRKLFGLTSRQYDKFLLIVCTKFVHETFMKRSYYVQEVLTEIKQTQVDKHLKRVNAGKKGGKASSNAISNASSNAQPIEKNRIDKNIKKKIIKENKFIPKTDLEKFLFETYPILKDIPLKIKAWEDSYPDADLIANFKNAVTNAQEKNKEVKGPSMYLTNWLKNGKEKGWGYIKKQNSGRPPKPHGASNVFDEETGYWVM
jgi:hypothetical protein